MFRSKDVEKSGTGFQRVNEVCKKQNVSWDYRKEAYGFCFEFIRTNVQINTELTEAEKRKCGNAGVLDQRSYYGRDQQPDIGR